MLCLQCGETTVEFRSYYRFQKMWITANIKRLNYLETLSENVFFLGSGSNRLVLLPKREKTTRWAVILSAALPAGYSRQNCKTNNSPKDTRFSWTCDPGTRWKGDTKKYCLVFFLDIKCLQFCQLGFQYAADLTYHG